MYIYTGELQNLLLWKIVYTYTVEPRYPDTRFSRHSAYHVSFSKSRFSVYDFNVNKLRILRHYIIFNSGYPDGLGKLAIFPVQLKYSIYVRYSKFYKQCIIILIKILIYLFCLCFCLNVAMNSKRTHEDDIPLSMMFKEQLNRKMDVAEKVQRYFDFDKDVSTSPDATTPEIVKEIKGKQAEISFDQESESDLELEQNKPLTKTEALHCLQTIRNYLTSISKTTDVDYYSMYDIGKRTVRNTSMDKQTLIHQYFKSHNKKLNRQISDFYFF